MTEPKREERYDALVVGGGVIGLACAWRAARRGLSVCVLERDTLGAGATGVAAGMLAPVGEASWGEDDLLALSLKSHRLWSSFAKELAAESGSEVGYLPHGALHVALDRDEAEALRRRHELHTELGLSSRWLRPGECRELEPGLSPGTAGGVHAEHEASVDPGLLGAALAAAIESRGGQIETGAEVVEADLGAPRSSLRTADGREFEGRDVVLATGCWAGRDGWLQAADRPPIRPVKGEILTLGGPATDHVCDRIVATERVYVVPRADGRLMIGATAEERGFETKVTAGGVLELLREAYRALPDVAELELIEARAGLRPATPDNRPLIGRGSTDGLVFAAGHFRNGILQAPITAESVAALLAGEEPSFDIEPFSPLRFATDREGALR
jgi:glycine oxidase